MDITGVIKAINPTEQVSDKFKKREFVLTDNSSQYPQHILLQLTQDKCGLLDKYKLGDSVKAHINLRGREWTSPKGEIRYFNTIEAWRIEKGDATDSMGNVAEQHFSASGQEDDLPF